MQDFYHRTIRPCCMVPKYLPLARSPCHQTQSKLCTWAERRETETVNKQCTWAFRNETRIRAMKPTWTCKVPGIIDHIPMILGIRPILLGIFGIRPILLGTLEVQVHPKGTPAKLSRVLRCGEAGSLEATDPIPQRGRGTGRVGKDYCIDC